MFECVFLVTALSVRSRLTHISGFATALNSKINFCTKLLLFSNSLTIDTNQEAVSYRVIYNHVAFLVLKEAQRS